MIAALTAANTAMARKAYRQLEYGPPEWWIRASTPASTGEMKPAPVSAAAQMEMAWARCLMLWVPAASIATDVGKIAAAPIPAITWPVRSTPTPLEGVKNPMSPPTIISAAPMASSRLRPNRSPTTPKESSSSVTGTRKASEIHVSWVEDVPRSWLMKPLMTAGIDRPIWATATAPAAANKVPRLSV